MSFGKIYSYPGNPTVYKVLAVAAYNGLEIEEVKVDMGKENKSEEYLKKFPTGLVPGFEGADGFTIWESSAIAYYVASAVPNTKLLGRDAKEASLIQQWVSFADSALQPHSFGWILPTLGSRPYDEKAVTESAEKFKKDLRILEDHLKSNKWLVGDVITLADISVASSLVRPFRNVIDAQLRESLPNLTKWYQSVIGQEETKNIWQGATLVEKAIQYNPKA